MAITTFQIVLGFDEIGGPIVLVTVRQGVDCGALPSAGKLRRQR